MSIMSDSVALSAFDDEPAPDDFRRSNGAPMVRSPENPERWVKYSRPSGFGKDLDDESALVLWRIDRAMDGVASSPALAAKVASKLGKKDGRKDLRDEAILVGRGDESADLGTALHAMTHRVESEEGYVAVEPFASDLACYLGHLDEAGLVSEHIEVHLCSDTWKAAGTADRIYRATRELIVPNGPVIEPGQLIMGDLKTGKKLDYSLPGYCVQLAIYVDSVFYDVNTQERSPLPDNLRTDWGVLVHLPAGSTTCTFLWVDLEVGRQGARIVREVREWRKRDDFAAPFTFPQSDMVAVLDSTLHDLEHEVPEPAEDDVRWCGAMLPWAQARINIIGSHPASRQMLIRRWPAGVPPLRDNEPTPAQLTTILNLLDAIESAYSLPFPEGDPRVEWNQGLHKSEVDRSNKPPSTKEPSKQ
jgi:hypothetical protein